MAESFEGARALILARVSPLGVESVGLLEMTGRVLAEDIRAPWDMPRWNNSAMDGFAVRAKDCGTDAPLPVAGYIPAGSSASGIAVEPGQAVRIMTGAPTPSGCDAIVPIEETIDTGEQVVISGQVEVGAHIRVCGEDVRKNELVIAAGSLLRPAEINMLAALGFERVPVFRKPRVAILSTGDELVEPGQNVGPGQIINSNAYSLAAAVTELGGEALLLGIARDNRESLEEKLRQGFQADALITSAGVSMGDRDLVCEMLQEAGVEHLFLKVDIKPGRPTAFGLQQGKPVFSLPGNPVSTMLTFEEFVRPALLKMMGCTQVIKPFVTAILQKTLTKKAGRVQFLRVRVVNDAGRLCASSAGDQNTGILATMLRANGIAVLAADCEGIKAGEEVNIHLFSPVVDPDSGL